MATKRLEVLLVGSAKSAVAALEETGAAADTMSSRVHAAGQRMTSVGRTVTTHLTLPIVAAGAVAYHFASDLQSAMTLVRNEFDGSAPSVIRFTRNSADSMGMARAEALKAAGEFGTLFRTMGDSAPVAASMSEHLMRIAADEAAVHDQNPADAMEAFRKGMTGATRGLKGYGIVLDTATIKQEAGREGLLAYDGSMSAQAKTQAIYHLVLARTTHLHEQARRAMHDAAWKQRELMASAKDLAASFGTFLLPIGEKVLGWVKGLSHWVQHLSPHTRKLVVVFAAVAAAGGPLLMVVGSLVTAIGAIGLPVIAVVAALAALGVGLYIAYQRSETFRSTVQGVWAWLKGPGVQIVMRVRDALVRAFNAVVAWVRRNWPEISHTFHDVAALIGTYATFVRTMARRWVVVLRAVGAVISDLWRRFGHQWLRHLQVAFRAISEVVRGALQIVRGVIDIALGIITLKWGRAWRGIREVVAGVWHVIRGLVRAGINGVSGLIGAGMAALSSGWHRWWNNLHSVVSAVWDRIKGTVRGAINAVRSEIGGFLGPVATIADRVGLDSVAHALRAVAPSHASGTEALAVQRAGSSGFRTSGVTAIVGEGSRSHPEFVIPTDPRHRARALDLFSQLGSQILGVGGLIGGAVSGIGSAVSGAVNMLPGSNPLDIARNVIAGGLSHMWPVLGVPQNMLGIPPAAFNTVRSTAIDFIKGGAQKVVDRFNQTAAVGAPGSVVAWLTEALNDIGLGSMVGSWMSALVRRVMQESGGNPHAINLWDSNAAAGHPSKGLLQTIDGTFNAYKIPGHGDIWNPVDNAIAAIRYMISRYGSPLNLPAGGYDRGGWLPTGLSLAYNGTGRPERVVGPSGHRMDMAPVVVHVHGHVIGVGGAKELAAIVTKEQRRQARAYSNAGGGVN